MRRSVRPIVAAALALALVGCGSGSGRDTQPQGQSVADVLQEQTQGTEGASAEGQGDSFVGDAQQRYDDSEVEVDLTAMGPDMVYATVFDMLEHPDDYLGKVVRMGGPFYHSRSEATKTDYFFVVIKDATACCSQGMEFVWGNGEHAYPAEYPADGDEVVVTGVFETYVENGQRYAHVAEASLVGA